MRWSSGSRNARIPRREPSGKRILRGWFNLGAQKTFWKTLHDKGKLVLRRERFTSQDPVRRMYVSCTLEHLPDLL